MNIKEIVEKAVDKEFLNFREWLVDEVLAGLKAQEEFYCDYESYNKLEKCSTQCNKCKEL